jgi:hypothetical protein
MLSVIVVDGDADRLAGLLAVLTPAAVEGLVREVLIATAGPADLLRAVCDHTGAERAPDFASALRAARSDLLLIAEPNFRPREGWVERLSDHLRSGGRAAKLLGQGGGWIRPAPAAVIVERVRAMKCNDFRALGGTLRGAAKLG